MPPADGGWDAFKTHDVYSMEIEQGMIGSNILEGQLFGHQFGKAAEIAILANVFEFSANAGEAEKRRFLESDELAGKADDPSDVELKLIYFGDDVHKGQAFNFSNVPLRPRTEYSGGSVGIQIVVMEVDAQAGPVASLLKTLARFGQQALPGPGEAKDMLYDLGESLLSGSQDDKLFEYRFVLSAAPDNPRAAQATFAPGRYVLMRKESRATDMGWSSLRLDHNTARLFRKAANGTDYDEVRDDLYMVLNVRRYPAGTAAEFYNNRDWSSFRSALQAAADAKAAPLDKVTEDIAQLLGKERSANWRADLDRSWAVAEDRLNLYSSRYMADFTGVNSAACGVTADELERRRDTAQRGAEDALRRFVLDYKQAMDAPVKDKTGAVVGKEFSDADRERLVSTLASYFMPWSVTAADPAQFQSQSAFETAFMANGAPASLTNVALEAARHKERSATSKTCSTLLAR